ncbi:Spy/CpxP family protein refolding chaperone [Plesiocystis pacifica]|nr:periplasmic heavy metal sensor [Plesiocystis pacifica]
MSIASLIGTRLATGLGALAIAGSVAGGAAATAYAAPERGDRTETRADREDGPLKAFRQDLREQTKADREAVEEMRRELAQEYAKDSPDTAKMERLFAAIEAREDAISETRFDAWVRVHAELTPEQRAKAAQRMAKGKGGKGKHGKAKPGKGKPGKGKGKGKGHHADDRPSTPAAAEDVAKPEPKSKRERRRAARAAKKAEKAAR